MQESLPSWLLYAILNGSVNRKFGKTRDGYKREEECSCFPIKTLAVMSSTSS